jgi:hypothetical protein
VTADLASELGLENRKTSHRQADRILHCSMKSTKKIVQRYRSPQQRLFLEQKFHLAVLEQKIPMLVGGGAVMTTLQAMCLGAMLAWTPSLVVLALLLREAPLDEFDEL